VELASSGACGLGTAFPDRCHLSCARSYRPRFELAEKLADRDEGSANALSANLIEASPLHSSAAFALRATSDS
jgi:hypothetical protein